MDLPEKFEFTRLALPEHWGPFVVAVLTVAIIASIESLLCAVATDKLHSGVRSDLDKELRAQGAGNLVSGLLGGLPITGVIVRSSANIIAGGATRWSAILHGVWVLLFAAFLGGIIEQIPLAVLAGLLVHVGINLVNLHHIRDLHTHKEAPIYFATVLGVVGLNLLAGVGLGLALSVFFLLRRLSNTDIKVEQAEGKWHVRIGGTLHLASVPAMNAASPPSPRVTRGHRPRGRFHRPCSLRITSRLASESTKKQVPTWTSMRPMRSGTNQHATARRAGAKHFPDSKPNSPIPPDGHPLSPVKGMGFHTPKVVTFSKPFTSPTPPPFPAMSHSCRTRTRSPDNSLGG